MLSRTSVQISFPKWHLEEHTQVIVTLFAKENKYEACSQAESMLLTTANNSYLALQDNGTCIGQPSQQGTSGHLSYS